MIPTTKEIRSKLTQSQIQYVLLNDKTYFKTADKFVSLKKQFVPETLLATVGLWMDMVVSPLITLFQIVFSKKVPDLFTILSVQKTVSTWLAWFEWKQCQQTIREWIKIIRAIDGPFISCNDAEYHMFVYADGMQRVHDALLGSSRISKERTKRL
jgi:hypothetical protein